MRRFALLILLLPICAQAQPEWSEHALTTAIAGQIGLRIADINGDDLSDVVIGDYVSGIVYWVENGGDIWTVHQIGGEVSGTIDHDAADFDLDGDLDVCSAVFNLGQVVVFLNGGGAWSFQNVGALGGVRKITTADMDNDGDPDIIAAGSSGVQWWENQGGGWASHFILSGDLWGLVVDDYDLDGDMDVLSSSTSSQIIRWHENTGGGWTVHTVSNVSNGPKDLSIGDLDDDGDQDVACAASSSSQIVWYENQNYTTWPAHIVSTDFNVANDVLARDVDLDGDVDLAGASYGGSGIRYWDNTGGGVFTQSVLQADLSGAWNVDVGDLDGDGDPDIAAAAYLAATSSWWEQLGTPGPVHLNLYGTNTVIPPNGGTMVYDVQLVSDLPNSVAGVSFWTSVRMPNGQLFGPMLRVNFTLQPFMNVFVTGLTLDVPALAPPGIYLYTGYLGYFPAPQLEDGITFTKSGGEWTDSLPFDPEQWKATGDFGVTDEASQSRQLPSSYALSETWPNPFNAATSLRVELPEASELTIRVHNVAGRQVVELAHGAYAAGQHTFTLEGSGLATGVYFVRALVPGKLDQTRKVMLLK